MASNGSVAEAGTMRTFVSTFEPALNEALRRMIALRPADPATFFAVSAATQLAGAHLHIPAEEQLGAGTQTSSSFVSHTIQADGSTAPSNGISGEVSVVDESTYLTEVAGVVEDLIASSLESAAQAADENAGLMLAKSLLKHAHVSFEERVKADAQVQAERPWVSHLPTLGTGASAHSPVLEAAKEAAKAAAADVLPTARPDWTATGWSKQLNIDKVIAEGLTKPLEQLLDGLNPAQQSAAELAYFRSIGQQLKDGECRAELLAQLLQPVVEQLGQTYASAAEQLTDNVQTLDELSNKFASEGELYFGDVPDFNAGLDATIGPPHPNLYEQMQREHTSASYPDATTYFRASSYGIESTSQIEWWFVVDPANGRIELGLEAYPDEPYLSVRKKRHEMPLHTFDVAVAEVNASLRQLSVAPMRVEELIGSRLYTGPMFQKYNVVMRGYGPGRPTWASQQFEKLCQGNIYATSIHVVNSIIVKLGKLTHAHKVYRGVSGRGLPKKLTETGEAGVIGGVDMAFLSTTRDREVAMQYASNKESNGRFGLVIEMQQGLVDRGADLSWLSQYPFEREILFAPLTALEVLDSRIEGRVQVVSVRPTVNQKAQTIEQAIAKMQHAQVQLVDLLVDDLKRRGAPQLTLRPLDMLKTSHQLRESAWFNEGLHIQQATSEAITARKESMRLLQQAATWTIEGHNVDAAKMCLAAELFAVENDHDAALRLLLISLKQRPHPRLSKEDVEYVVELSQSAEELTPAKDAEGAPVCVKTEWTGAGGEEQRLGGFECLLVLQLLLVISHGKDPWPGAIVRLLSGMHHMPAVQQGFVELLRKHEMLATADALAVGERVLADETLIKEGSTVWEESSWHDAIIVAPPPAGEPNGLWSVRFGKRTAQARYVLPVGEGGAGGLLRAAAEQGEEEMVEMLLNEGVCVLEADPRANTALHVAASHQTQAHARIAEILVAAGEKQGEERGVTMRPGTMYNADGVRPIDMAMMSGNAEMRCAIKPSSLDRELKAFLLEVSESKGESMVSDSSKYTILEWLNKHVTDPAEACTPGVYGVTYLMVACARGQVDAAVRLIDMKADPCSTTTSGCTPLSMAAHEGHLYAVSALLDSVAEAERNDLVNHHERKNITALMRASQNGFPGVVALLLRHKATVQDVRDDVKRDALILGARNGHLEVCQHLARAGASLTQLDEDGRSALASAAKYGHAPVLEFLSDLLISRSRSGDKLDEEGQKLASAALALASRFGHDAAVRILVQRDVSVETPDEEGMTPLIWACLRGHETVIPNLLEATKQVDQPDAEGRTPLMLCCANGHIDAVHMLFSAKADLLATDKKGMTVLMHATSAGQTSLVPTLMRTARDKAEERLLNMKDHTGRTALMHATHVGSTVRAMLQAGADRLEKDDAGWTALMLAFADGRDEVIRGFREVADALSLHRPPLKALENLRGKDADQGLLLGVGAFVIDVGTGEMKMMGALHFERCEMYELSLVKMANIGDSKATSATIFTAGYGHATKVELMTPEFHAVVTALRDGLDKARSFGWYSRVTWMDFYLGATAWYRQMDKDKQLIADEFLDALMQNLAEKLAEMEGTEGVTPRWECLSGDMEAQCEYKAVDYAMREQRRTAPIAIFAGGSGSVQVTGLDTFGSFPSPLKTGIAILDKAESLEAGRVEWQEWVRNKCEDTPLTKMVAHAAENSEKPVGIVLISAFFYVAVTAGLVPKSVKIVKHDSKIEHMAPDVLIALEKVYTDEAQPSKERANAMRLHALLHRIFGEHVSNVSCSFARDWELDGGTPFRTTWTAGWWLDQLILEYQRETFPESTQKSHEKSSSTRNSAAADEEQPPPSEGA